MSENPLLDQFTQNPWQTRQEKPDPAYITELADDIARNGLIQIPVGRLVNGSGDPIDPDSYGGITNALKDLDIRVQLAVGHNRLLAYRHNFSEKGAGWGRMPVDVRDLTDEQMATIAWSENERRRDLSPIERATAIQQRMESFGWNQEKIAEVLGLSRPAISNALRLLRLPDHLQELVHKNTLSERQAMALLPLSDLPDVARNVAENSYYIKPSEIERDAINGRLSSDAIREKVDAVISFVTNRLQSAPWPLDKVFEIENIEAPNCSECSKKIQRGSEMLCPLANCWNIKQDAWRKETLSQEQVHPGSGLVSAPTPSPAPIPAPAAKDYDRPRPSAARTTAQPPRPEPEPEPPPKPLTWAESTITATITWWPEETNGRTAIVGIRLNNEAPKIHMIGETDVALTPAIFKPLASMVAELRDGHEEETQTEEEKSDDNL